MKKIIAIKFHLLLFFGVLVSLNSSGQDTISTGKIAFGFESEIMTWVNGGFHGSFWIGKNGHRARLVIAKATYPDYLNPEGFRNLTSTFYEIETDHFFGKKRNKFRGLWFAIGAGYTKQNIESETTNQEGIIDLFDIHSGVGYAINVYKSLYINPWIGIDIHVNAPDKVLIDSEIWYPRMIDPVLGAKIGYSF